MLNLFKKFKDESIKEQLGEFLEDINKFEQSSGQKFNLQEACDKLTNGTGDFGHSLTNPIPVNGIKGEIKYLNRLRCECGIGLIFHRLGSLITFGIEGNIDIYETVCIKGEHWNLFYLHMYHPRRSTLTPKGYSFSNFHPIYSKNILAFGTHTEVEDFPFGLPDKLIKIWGSTLGEKMANNLNKEISDKSKFVRPPAHQKNIKNLSLENDGLIRITAKNFALILLDNLKKFSEHSYKVFSQRAQTILGIKLDNLQSITLTREIYMINLWIISKILSPDKNILDELHKIYILPHINQVQIDQWLNNKETEKLKNVLKQDEADLRKRYAEYYSDWDEKSGDQSILAITMMQNMYNQGLPDKRFVRADLTLEVNMQMINVMTFTMRLREKYKIID